MGRKLNSLLPGTPHWRIGLMWFTWRLCTTWDWSTSNALLASSTRPSSESLRPTENLAISTIGGTHFPKRQYWISADPHSNLKGFSRSTGDHWSPRREPSSPTGSRKAPRSFRSTDGSPTRTKSSDKWAPSNPKKIRRKTRCRGPLTHPRATKLSRNRSSSHSANLSSTNFTAVNLDCKSSLCAPHQP